MVSRGAEPILVHQLTELEQIAQSVAKALGLKDYPPSDGARWHLPEWDGDNSPALLGDGSNLFDPYWRCRCMDWLLKQGYRIVMRDIGKHYVYSLIHDYQGEAIECPASEFCARVIHELIKGEPEMIDPS